MFSVPWGFEQEGLRPGGFLYGVALGQRFGEVPGGGNPTYCGGHRFFGLVQRILNQTLII